MDSLPYCDPCATEAGWENVHSDDAHDALAQAIATNVYATWMTPAILADAASTPGFTMANCWICHPELNQAAKDYTPRTGTPRTDAAKTPHRSHAGCDHAVTPKARAACRKAGGPKA